MRGVLEAGSEIVFCGPAAVNPNAVEAAVASMNKSCFENQKYLAARLMRISRENKLKVSAYTLLVAHVKTVAFSAKDGFRIPAKDETSSGLRKREIEMRT